MSDKKSPRPISAFPVPQIRSADGMTLRDYFGAQALQGLLAKNGTGDSTLLAQVAFTIADAMMEARKS